MKNKSIRICALFLTGSLFVMGCLEEEDSCNVRTPGIYAQYDVSEKNGQASVEATFWVGDNPGGTYLELGSCGDTIEVNGEKLRESGNYPTRYKGTMPASDRYTFAFIRPGEEAYFSTADNVPLPVDIRSPNGEKIARDEDLEILWTDNGNSQIQLSLSSQCVQHYGETLTDDGEHVISANTLTVVQPYCTKSCAATVTLTRNFSGDMSPHLKGTMRGRVQSTAYFDTIAAQNEVPYNPAAQTDTEGQIDTN